MMVNLQISNFMERAPRKKMIEKFRAFLKKVNLLKI
jgi:predicted protein tyrosine phosphatase